MNRPYYIPIADLKAGDTIIPDADFTCLPEGVPVLVRRDNWFLRNLPASVLRWFGAKPTDKWPAADLYVECADGKHSLDGQLNDDRTHFVGFIKAETPNEEEADDDITLSDEEIVSYEAELTEDVDTFKAGHRFTIMAVDGGKLRLLDDDGNALLVERAKIKVAEW